MSFCIADLKLINLRYVLMTFYVGLWLTSNLQLSNLIWFTVYFLFHCHPFLPIIWLLFESSQEYLKAYTSLKFSSFWIQTFKKDKIHIEPTFYSFFLHLPILEDFLLFKLKFSNYLDFLFNNFFVLFCRCWSAIQRLCAKEEANIWRQKEKEAAAARK